MDLASLLPALIAGDRLGVEQAYAAIGSIMDGQPSDAQIAAFLTALASRGESAEELTGAVKAMRERAAPFAAPTDAIDVCGTGGDGQHTWNISTAVAFVVAGCGVPVVKHGNKAVSSASGSSDVLTELGIDVDVPASVMERALADTSIAFLFAPRYHPAMKHVAPVRKALGFRTLFNLIGPLSNPAGVSRQLVGVYDKRWLAPLAETLKSSGATRAWIVHGSDGLDECTTTGPTEVCALEQGTIMPFSISPEDAGLPLASARDLRGSNAATNAAKLRALLEGEAGPYRDIVLFNAAAALIVASRTDNLADGTTLAAESIDSGQALHCLTTLQRISQAGVKVV